MYFYILLIRIAAFFGHRKARLMVEGQKQLHLGGQHTDGKHTDGKHIDSQHTDGTQLTVNGKEIAKGAVWIHVSSVGEFEQARPLIERLRKEQPQRKIVLTFFSPSGYELRKNYELVDAVLYLPFAIKKNAQAFIEALQPQMAIFVKYEFWPAYLRELKKRGIPTYSISAIFRPGQLFFKPWGKWYLKLLHCFTHIYVQDEASQALLQQHGIGHCSVAGDTRFDRVYKLSRSLASGEKKDERLRPIDVFTQGCERVIVAGSTWPKDEELLEKALRDQVPSTKLILAPHEIHEEHLHFIFNLFQGRAIRYTTLIGLDPIAQRNMLQHMQVLVVDTIGLLSSIYYFGQVAYIGGGFGAGIHNTIEAAVYGMPVIFGPNYHHFREAKGLIAAEAGYSIRNSRELEQALDTALAHHAEAGARAASYVQSELGATDKIYKELFNTK